MGDFCFDNESTEPLNFDFHDGANSWHSKASSWRCGARTSIQLCREGDGCENGDSGSGGSYNLSLPSGETLSSIELTPYNRDMNVAATAFTGLGCSGRSSAVWLETDTYSSDSKYSSTSDSLSVGTGI